MIITRQEHVRGLFKRCFIRNSKVINFKQYQIVSESRRIKDGEDRIREISKKVTIVLTGLFRDGSFAVIEAVHLEAASVEAFPVVILVAAHQYVGQA